MTSPESVDKGLANHLVGNALSLLVLVDESSNEHGSKSGGSDSIHAVVGVWSGLFLSELGCESHSETVLKPVLNIVSRLFNLELERLVNPLKFTFVCLVHNSHLLPDRCGLMGIIFPGSCVRGENELIIANLCF